MISKMRLDVKIENMESSLRLQKEIRKILYGDSSKFDFGGNDD